MNLSAITHALAVGVTFVVVGPITWHARGIWFNTVERPSIVREATRAADDAAAIRIADAANRAEHAERERQERASEDALRIYREALERARASAAATQTKLEQEIEAYVDLLEREGSTVPRLTQRDLDWVRPQPGD